MGQVDWSLRAVLLHLGIVFLLLREQLGDLAEDLELLDLVEAADLLELDVEGAREDLVGVDVRGEEGRGLGVCGGMLAVRVFLELVYSVCLVLAIESPSTPHPSQCPRIDRAGLTIS